MVVPRCFTGRRTRVTILTLGPDTHSLPSPSPCIHVLLVTGTVTGPTPVVKVGHDVLCTVSFPTVRSSPVGGRDPRDNSSSTDLLPIVTPTLDCKKDRLLPEKDLS